MASYLTVRVHPVVLFSMVDAYERRSLRPGANTKAIGALLGSFERNVVHIGACYSVPFTEEGDTPQLDPGYTDTMKDMFLRAAPSELPVGWFSTDAELVETDLSYHDYFVQLVAKSHTTKETLPCVALRLDTTLRTGRMGLRAYVKSAAGVPGIAQPHCAMFTPVTVEIDFYKGESVALGYVARGLQDRRREVTLSSGLNELSTAVSRMLEALQQVRSYVAAARDNPTEADAKIGRKLAEIVATAQQAVAQTNVDQLIASGIRDHLMVMYLAQLVQTQLTLYKNMVSV